jgi:two-component system, sensor histidine kinase
VTTAVIVATLVGGGAVYTFTLQAHFAPNLAMNLPMLMPAAALLLTRLDVYGVFGAAGVSTLCVIMLAESRRAERRITELLWLRFTTDRIAQERADALKLAQRHSAIKDQFLATMSHEMRTPLHGILGLAQLIHQRLPARPGPLSDARQHAGLIQRSGEHLLSLINDVLDFSRIEAGRLQIDPRPFDLQQVLGEVLALIQVTAASKQLVLHQHIDLPHPCLVTGDAARVRQVLFNLLGNAVKFTESGHVRLTAARRSCGSAKAQPGMHAAAHAEDHPDDHINDPCARRISFDIEDTGPGIPPDQVERVFEAFAQLDASFGRRHQGTGLGLTISRELARAMGGDIVCQSTPGQGSTFRLTLPLPQTDEESTFSPRSAPMPLFAASEAPSDPNSQDTAPMQATVVDTHHARSANQVSTEGGALDEDDNPSRAPRPPSVIGSPAPAEVFKGKVLLVEDNSVNALVAQSALTHLGLEVTLVTDGEQALAKLVPGPHGFDVVLMDCQMPVLDGIEATRRLRAHENEIGSPNVPVIALTANAMPTDRQRCAAAGMDDHLAKPFSQADLYGVLARHLLPHATPA